MAAIMTLVASSSSAPCQCASLFCARPSFLHSPRLNPSTRTRSSSTRLRSSTNVRQRRGRRLHPIQSLFSGWGKKQEKGVMETPPQAKGLATPPYEVLKSGDGYEVRMYQPYMVAETVYQSRPDGFNALGGYMDGDNEANEKMAATTPVVMLYPGPGQADGGDKVMQLYVGQREGGSLPPMPSDPDVTLSVAGGETVAVARFSGNATPQAAAAALKSLRSALARDGVRLASEGGEFRVAQYGPIFSLRERTNEIIVRVDL